MAKGSRRLALGMLLLPLVYAAVLRLNVSPVQLGRFQLHRRGPASLSIWSDDAAGGGLEHARMIMRRLVRGRARSELSWNRVACITSDSESDFCITSDSVRIVAGPSRSATVYLTAGQKLPGGAANFTLQPYPRKTDSLAMARTAPIHIISGAATPSCDVVHTSPAVVFSTGGFAGNFFHDINDVLIPVFLTAGRLRPSNLVVVDYEDYWVSKYRRVLTHLAGGGDAAIVVASSPSSPVEPRVHCFPAAVVGLKYHDNLACNATVPPGGVTIRDFRRFIHESLSLPSDPLGTAAGERPLLVFLSRRKSRALLNEGDVVDMAREVGFNVEVVTPEMMRDVEAFARLVATASVLGGMHGAGMTNMVFLRMGAVLLQVVPWGLDWAAKAYYGRPAVAMGLEYVEYRVAVEESTLSDYYPPEHPVLADPWSIHRQGYNVSGPIYTDGQNVRLDLARFKGTLLETMHRIPRRPS
ncbi:hypothetical protein Taro_004426 [Colocasia esculenta]|uniref:Glycosyltransferase 61 catalytic domain-containing protein n=1 Tax=Colocasia esculenta TaxID=4460 RepID=A0A843TI27_COLES|nr:hypothetical protein [Colocasia esculenta]